MRSVEGTSEIASLLSKARRALKGNDEDREVAAEHLAEALALYDEEVAWRSRSSEELSEGLETYDLAIRDTIGVRLQPRLTTDQATTISTCLSKHRDISLNF